MAQPPAATPAPAGASPAPAAAAPVDPGPPTSSAGTPYQWKNVTILGGGFVTGIIFSPVQAGLVYARTDVGGAYRFDPKALRWIPLTDQFPRKTNFMGVESLAADPVDANKVYAAVGTYTQSWAGNGAILRSQDRGATWDLVDMPFKMGGNENGRSNGERLAIDPNQPKILYFGSRKNGLWRSEDSAEHWKKVESFPIKDDPDGLGIPFVVFDAKRGTKGKPTPWLYVGVSRTDTSLYLSRDAGKTFEPVAKQPTGMMPAHAAFDGAGVLYLSYGNGPGPSDVRNGAVFKLDPRTQRFTDITPQKPSQDDSDKFGYAGLAVDAEHPGTLMVTTIDRWTKGDEAFRTNDGGKTWKPLFSNAAWDVAGAQYLYWHRDKLGVPHWIGDIDIDPFDPAHVMFVDGAGLWRSTDVTQADAGKPVHFRFSPQGLEETVVGVLRSPPSGPQLLSGMADVCGFAHDDLDRSPKDGMYSDPVCNGTTGLDFAALHPNVVVRVGTVWGEGKHGAYSQDGGKSWKAFGKEPENGKTGGTVAISADGKTVIWVTKKEVPVVSSDFGTTWTPIDGLPVPVEAPDWVSVNLRVASDRVNPDKFYVYDTADGRAYVSTDAGRHFEVTASNIDGLPDYARSSGSIRAVPGHEGHVWLSTGKAVFRSTDSGMTYEELSNVEESHAIGFGKPGPGRSYPAVYLIGKVSDVYGFFRSDDVGKTWVRINDDRHQFGFAGAITGDPRVFGRVYVGTGGRGILVGTPR